jgi:phage terminase large subunit GpA-like protein
MAKCDTCGNDYDKAFTIEMSNQTHTFDSFECAIHALAPTCAHCGCRVIGHGVEYENTVYCCEHCAMHAHESTSTPQTARRSMT